MSKMINARDFMMDHGLYNMDLRIHVSQALLAAHPGVMRLLGSPLDGYSFDEAHAPLVLNFITDPAVIAAAKAKGKVGQKPKPPKMALMIAGKSYPINRNTLPSIQALIDDLSKMECNT